MSLFPCRRSHPARVVRRVSQGATAHTAFAFPVAGSASGALHFRGHRCIRLRYSLETRHHPADGAVERLQRVGFPSPCAPSCSALAFPLVGLPPTEHASLSWTHNRSWFFTFVSLALAHSLSGYEGQRHCTRGALAWRTLDVDGPMVSHDDFTHDIELQACPFRIHTIERFKKDFQPLFGDGTTSI